MDEHRSGDGSDNEEASHSEDDGSVDEEDSGSDGVFAPASPKDGFPLEQDDDCHDRDAESKAVVLRKIHDFEGSKRWGVRVGADLFHFGSDPNGYGRPDEERRCEEGGSFQVGRGSCPQSFPWRNWIDGHNQVGQSGRGWVTEANSSSLCVREAAQEFLVFPLCVARSFENCELRNVCAYGAIV